MQMNPLLSGKRAVIFDLFHTLIEVKPEAGNGRYTPDILGIDRKVWNEVLWNDTHDRVVGIDRDPTSIIRKVAHRIDPTIPEHLIVEATQSRLKRFEKALEEADPRTVQTLGALRQRGFKVGLISNADVTEVSAWPRSPLAPHFDSVVFSCDVGLKKPDAAIYEHSLSELGVTAADAVFVGDGGSDELRGAQSVGLTTVMMCGIIGKTDPQLLEMRRRFADHEVHDVAELLR
jgi:putative hydrolase of the HAD superfamily